MSDVNLPSKPNTLVNFHQQLAIYQQRVDQALTNFINSLPVNNTNLVPAMRYGALLGGKRLRPYLVYATGQMFGLSLNSLDAPAAAIECIHAYSLIHDDLPAMDNDDLRRGQLTCHIKFGEANAILAGDALQTLAFSILADQPMPDIVIENRLAMLSELARSSGAAGMCGGQALDIAAEKCHVSLPQLEQIHHNKTGALIRAAIRISAFAAGDAGKQVLPLLNRYAEAIGLAFQVQDDILDITGETTKIGKRQGSDQQLGKSTYPALLGLGGARKKALDLYQEALTALDSLSAHGYNTVQLRALACFVIERDS